ncbi:MAG: orotate phosphoribosyltransferase [Clostridiales bacterium]|nr:orotate phosphoribosyltransferase [Clostridiales bacterium]MCD8370929.1 orotate phosphoribosyltransferase [Clostridiales bacterium]
METKYRKIRGTGTEAELKVIPGHFATTHAHSNYYLDMSTLTTRTSEAQNVARTLAGMYLNYMVVDTIVCLEGTSAIGAFLSEELTRSGYLSMNKHKTFYIIRPEINSSGLILFRDNMQMAIRGKNIVVLLATVTTGNNVRQAVDSIRYYGGKLQCVSSIFSIPDNVDGTPVISVFGKRDVPDYGFYKSEECPLCKAGQKLDALVNAFGYTKI